MSETIPVVNVDEVREIAYDMAYDRFEGQEVDSDEFDLSGFRDGATYANHVLPDLRCLAGYDDRGHGTYTSRRDVAVIEEHQVDDVPAEADVMDSHHVFEEVSEAWQAGAYDGGCGNERYERIEF